MDNKCSFTPKEDGNLEQSTQPKPTVQLSPGVLDQHTNLQGSMTRGTSEHPLDVDRQAVIRLMSDIHDWRDEAIRNGDRHGMTYWDGAMYFGRKLFEMENE